MIQNMAKIEKLPGAPLPGPPPGAWFLDPIRSGLGSKPLKCGISQKFFTSKKITDGTKNRIIIFFKS